MQVAQCTCIREVVSNAFAQVACMRLVSACGHRPCSLQALHMLNSGIYLLVVKSDSQQSSSNQLKIQQQQQQPSSSQNNSNGFLQKVQQQWDGLDWQQRGYAVVLGVVVLAVVPQILSLLVLLLERVVIGGLLEFEEAFVALLFKGGALVSCLLTVVCIALV